MKYSDLTLGQVEAVVNKLGGMEGVKRFLSGEMVVKAVVGEVVRLFVDYTQPLSELIKSCNFDWINSDITEKHFPTAKRPNQEVEFKMFHFNRYITSDQVIQEMDEEEYRPAELPELLAYAKSNPDEQRKYPIVGLGSVWRNFRGSRYVPCLWRDSCGRGLDWYGSEWHERCRFLGVRK